MKNYIRWQWQWLAQTRAGAPALVLIAAVLLVGQIVTGLLPATPAMAQTLEEYRLGPGDRLNILVFGQQDLSGEFVIDGLGRISIPLVGQVDVKDKTVTELQQAVTELLEQDYLVNPRVSVDVLNYRPFYIYGQVNKPGSYPYVSGLTVRQALALAGGYTRRAREAPAVVTREIESEVTTVDVELNAAVYPGDTIEVERRLF